MAKPIASAKDPIGNDELRVLFFINRASYVKALKAKKEADAHLKNVGKLIKADLGPYGLDQIKAYEKAQSAEGQAELKAKFEAERQAMSWAGIPINTQLDMFIDRTPLVERAARYGEESGLRGDTLSNPYNEGSEEGQAYASGWHDGQAKLFAGIKKKEDAAALNEVIEGEDDDPFEEAAE